MSSSDNPQFEPRLDPQPLVSSDSLLPLPLPLPLPPAPLAPQSVAAPPRDPVWSGWDVSLIALVTVLTLIFVQVFTVIGARVLVYRYSSFADVAQKPVLALLGEFLSYVAVGTFMIMLVEGKYHQRFWQAIRWNWPSSNLEVSLLGLVGMLTIILDALGNRYLPLPKSTPFDQFFAHPRDAYLTVAFAVTFGPLMEEIFFRGFLYPVLARRTGIVWGVLLTALPFGLIHYIQYKSWAAVLVVALVGVVLTTVRAVTKSVAASFIVHVGYNGTLMVLAAWATDGFRHMEKMGFAQFGLR